MSDKIWENASEVKKMFFSEFDKSVEMKVNIICTAIVNGKTGLNPVYKKDSHYIEMFAKQLLKDDPKLMNYQDQPYNFLFKMGDKFEEENGYDVSDEMFDKYQKLYK